MNNSVNENVLQDSPTSDYNPFQRFAEMKTSE